MDKDYLNKVLSEVFPTESIYYIYLDEIFIAPLEFSNILSVNPKTSLIALIGGDSYPEDVYKLAEWIKDNTELKVCWYSGTNLRKDFPKEYFDYIKTGSYKEELGGLDEPTTNQRFYEIKSKDIKNIKGEVINSYRYLEDITFKFWKDVKFGDCENDEE